MHAGLTFLVTNDIIPLRKTKWEEVRPAGILLGGAKGIRWESETTTITVFDLRRKRNPFGPRPEKDLSCGPPYHKSGYLPYFWANTKFFWCANCVICGLLYRFTWLGEKRATDLSNEAMCSFCACAINLLYSSRTGGVLFYDKIRKTELGGRTAPVIIYKTGTHSKKRGFWRGDQSADQILSRSMAPRFGSRRIETIERKKEMTQQWFFLLTRWEGSIWKHLQTIISLCWWHIFSRC